MSMVPSGSPGSALEPAAGGGMIGVVGLEDVDASDFLMPRMNIEHTDAVFKNSLSGETFTELHAVVLGQVKGRVLWAPDIGDEDSVPLCKSYDFQTGHPGDDFPWHAAPGFDATAEKLPCASCPLKEWGSHPRDDNKPWCSEQQTFPMLLPDGDGEFTQPALITLQRSALTITKGYVSSFASAKQPMFVALTTIGLQQERRGSNRYCIPTFVKGRATDPADFGAYADRYLSIRTFLQTPRTKSDDDTTASSGGDAPAAGAPAGHTPAPPTAERYETDDEIPF